MVFFTSAGGNRTDTFKIDKYRLTGTIYCVYLLLMNYFINKTSC